MSMVLPRDIVTYRPHTFFVTHVDDDLWRVVRADGTVGLLDGPSLSAGTEFVLWEVEGRRVAFFLDAPLIVPSLESMNVQAVTLLSEVEDPPNAPPLLIARCHSERMRVDTLAGIVAVAASSYGIFNTVLERLHVALGQRFDVEFTYDHDRDGWRVGVHRIPRANLVTHRD
jgi:hypothetical protein